MAAFPVILEETAIIATTLMKYISKKNALQLIVKELSSKRNTGVVGTGSMSDPYNLYEKKLMLTRDTLKSLDKYK